MLIKYKMKNTFLIVFPLIGVLIFAIWYLKPTYSQNALHEEEVPEWLENTICISSRISDADAGPLVWSDSEHYLAFEFCFYNAETNQQITDYEVLEEILSLFQYTEEPFIYDSERSFNGKCFIYYDGIVPAGYMPPMFSGFGRNDLSKDNIKGIESFYMSYNVLSSNVRYKSDIQKQLDEMQNKKM